MKKTFSEQLKISAVHDYLSGMSYREVAFIYKTDHKTIMSWIKKSGVKRREKEEVIFLMSQKKKGKRNSISTEFKKNQLPWNYGTKGVMKVNDGSFKKGEHRSIATEFKKGKDHVCYIDGRSFFPYPSAFNNKLKTEIKNRDGNICQNCGMSDIEHKDMYKKGLAVHHINYNKFDSRKENLITLCRQCHHRSHNDKKYWEEFYKSKTKLLKYG